MATLLLVSRATIGAPDLHAQSGDSLTARMASAIASEGLVGAAWSVVTPDGVTLGAAGMKDLRRGVPMRPTDRVQVGSVAKTFIATGVLRLVTEGRVALDAPVARYLPDLPIDNPWEREVPLLVRHLLDHTGGLDDVRLWQVFTLRGDPDSPLGAALGPRAARVRVRHRPGARFSYSNSSYLLLGMLIERVTGMRYEEWLDQQLLAPLGMRRSTFAFVSQLGARGDTTLAMGHFDGVAPNASYAVPVRPSVQFTTTAEDMATFARFLMSDGEVNGRRLVDGALLRAMAVPTTTEAAQAGLASGYAQGLGRRERWGITGRCHTGNMGTFRAIICVYAEHQRAFFVSYNTDPEEANFDRVDSLIASSLGVPQTVLTPEAAPGVDPAAWNGWYVVRPNRFEQFAYLDEVAGVTRIAWDGRKLVLRPLQGAPRVLLPVGGPFFRQNGRRAATHVLTRAPDSGRIVTDGHRTLEQVPRWRVVLRWISAALGAMALLYLLLVGSARTVIAWRRRQLRSEALRWAAVVVLLLVLAPLLFLGQPFLAIGDPTPGNLGLALLTGLLPIAIAVSLVQRVRMGMRTPGAMLDAVALSAALQWCLVLAAWGLLPLTLWR